jgi:hypothetical protein
MRKFAVRAGQLDSGSATQMGMGCCCWVGNVRVAPLFNARGKRNNWPRSPESLPLDASNATQDFFLLASHAFRLFRTWILTCGFQHDLLLHASCLLLFVHMSLY